MALLTALAALLIFSQLVARFLASTQSNMDVLAALGMRRTGRSALGVAARLVAGLVAAPVALVVAASASGLFPTGLARTAEPDPGLRPDGLVLAVGLVAIPLVVGLLAAWPAWRVASTSPDRLLVPGRRSWWERFVSRLQAPAPLDIGIRMAFPGRQGSRGAAGTTSLFAVALGIAALVGAADLRREPQPPALHSRAVRQVVGCRAHHVRPADASGGRARAARGSARDRSRCRSAPRCLLGRRTTRRRDRGRHRRRRRSGRPCSRVAGRRRRPRSCSGAGRSDRWIATSATPSRSHPSPRIVNPCACGSSDRGLPAVQRAGASRRRGLRQPSGVATGDRVDAPRRRERRPRATGAGRRARRRGRRPPAADQGSLRHRRHLARQAHRHRELRAGREHAVRARSTPRAGVAHHARLHPREQRAPSSA